MGEEPQRSSELPAHLLGGSGLLMTGAQPGGGFFSEVTRPEIHLFPVNPGMVSFFILQLAGH